MLKKKVLSLMPKRSIHEDWDSLIRNSYCYKDNGGVSSALNLGIANMNGDYFTWLSHDDVYYPNKIETQVEYLRHTDDREIILYSDFELIDEQSRFLRLLRVPLAKAGSFRYHLTRYSSINGCTLLIPIGCFKRCGEFNTNLLATQDYDMWFRLSKKYDFVHQKEVLVKLRTHKYQTGVQKRKMALDEANQLKLKFLRDITEDDLINNERIPVALAYALCAKEMHRGGLFVARDYAIHLSTRKMAAISTSKKLKVMISLILLRIEIANIIPYKFILIYRSLMKYYKNIFHQMFVL